MVSRRQWKIIAVIAVLSYLTAGGGPKEQVGELLGTFVGVTVMAMMFNYASRWADARLFGEDSAGN